jgi:hypothetical protein
MIGHKLDTQWSDDREVRRRPASYTWRRQKRVFPSLASKLMVIVYEWFDLKIIVTAFWFGPQN